MGYILFNLAFIALLLIAGVGLHISLSLSGRLFLAFPVIYIISEYTLALAQRAGLNPWWALLLGVFASTLTGFLFAFLERRLSKDSFAVLGLASVFALVALTKSWQSFTNGVLGIAGIQRPQGFESLEGMFLICVILGVLVLILEAILLKTTLSRRWRALREAPHLLEGIGISSKKLSFWTMVLASALIGLTAPYAWLYQFIDPNTGGLITLLRAVSIAILVTQPKVLHVVYATLFVAILPELIRFLDLPSAVMGPVRSILYSLLLLVLLLVLQKKILNTNRQI